LRDLTFGSGLFFYARRGIMAGAFESLKRKPTQRMIGRETEEAWLERMSEEGAIAPAENIKGVQDALNPKPNGLGNIFKDFKLPDFPDIKPPDITWLKELFKDKSKWNKVGSFLSNQGQSENE